MKKICNRCDRELSLNLFHKDKHSKDGYKTFCIDCKDTKKEFECIICEKKFIKKQFLQKTCGYECARKNMLQTRNNIYKRTYIPHPRKFLEKENIKCPVCEKEFKICKGAKTKQKDYCSRPCYIATMSEKRIGENNPAYRNGLYVTKGKTQYARHITQGYGEKEFIRASKKIRQNQIDLLGYSYCEKCNRSSNTRFETHHIVYRSEAPKHENLHNPRNLTRICVQCHNDYHKEKDIRKDIVIERKLRELFPKHNLEKYIDDEIILKNNT